jgi:signal transduction histidine kinase
VAAPSSPIRAAVSVVLWTMSETGRMHAEHLETRTIRRPWFQRVPALIRIAHVLALIAGCVALVLLPFDTAHVGGYAAVVLAIVGVVTSRRHPWTGLLLVLAGVVVDGALGSPLALWTMAVFMVFAMALRGISAAVAGVLAGAVAFCASVYAHRAGLFDPAAITGFFASVTAAAVGNAIRNRDRYRTAQDERIRDALAARDNETHRRIVEERMRIARDLHDAVGHEVAVVSINLGVAEINLPPGAEQSRRAIEAAREGVQAVLSETQSILAVLRDEADDEADTTAVPGAVRLPELVESFRSIGMRVDARIEVDPGDLDREVDVAVYRIVQEALTNAHRHGFGTIRLQVSCSTSIVSIEVSNTVRPDAGSSKEGAGYGLVGIRERVVSTGGSLDVIDDGTVFTLRARVPMDGKHHR